MLFTTQIKTHLGEVVATARSETLGSVWKTEFDLRMAYRARPDWLVETHDQDGHLVARHTHSEDGLWLGPFGDEAMNEDKAMDTQQAIHENNADDDDLTTIRCSGCKRRWTLAFDDSGICPHCGGFNG